MEKFVEFFVENWQLLVKLAVLLLTALLVILLKKRPVNTTVDNSLIAHLVSWVIDAESLYGSGHGDEKLKFVIEKARLYLGDLFNEKDITKMVEFILSSPEKKEKNNG